MPPERRIVPAIAPREPITPAAAHYDAPSFLNAQLSLRRQKHKRTKTGCPNCRAKKVKCDERRPACSRCLKTGLDCPGYSETNDYANRNDAIDKKKASRDRAAHFALSTKPSDCPVIGNDQEGFRLFQVFHESAIPTISGHTPMRTWTVLIPQLCLTEPVIASSVLALTAFHDETELRHRPINELSSDNDLSPLHTYALRRYGKALEELRRHLQSPNASPVVVLVACNVLTAFEALRGKSEAAVAHIQSGNKIIESLKSPPLGGTSSALASCFAPQLNSAVSSPEPDRDDRDNSPPSNLQGEDMVRMRTTFTKLSNLIGSSEEQLMRPAPKLRVVEEVNIHECPQEFNTLDEARASLFYLINSARQVIQKCLFDLQEVGAPGPSDGVPRCLFLCTQLRRWESTLDRLLQRNSRLENIDHSTPPESSEIVLLRLWAKFMSVRVWSSILPSRAALDALAPDFEDLLELCERCINLQGESLAKRLGRKEKRPPVFIMDMGVLPVLFFIGRKCTDNALRWRAVRLLDRTPRREALWDAETVKKTLTQILANEERAEAEIEDGRLPDLHGVTVGDYAGQSPRTEPRQFPKWQDFFFKSLSHPSSAETEDSQSRVNDCLAPGTNSHPDTQAWTDWLAIRPGQLNSPADSLYYMQVSGKVPGPEYSAMNG